MTIRMLALLMTGAMLTPLANAQAPQRSTSSADGNCAGVNLLTPEEKAAGWTLLFDGASKGGWHGYNKRDTQAWIVEDCALKTTGTETNYGSDLRPDLVTDAEYTNFELSLDWKATKGGNSGIMSGVVEDPKYEAAWMTGPEYN